MKKCVEGIREGKDLCNDDSIKLDLFQNNTDMVSNKTVNNRCEGILCNCDS